MRPAADARVDDFDVDQDGMSEDRLEYVVELANFAKKHPREFQRRVLDLLQRLNDVQSEQAEAAATLARMRSVLDELNRSGAVLCRMEAVRETPSGPRAICRINATVRELAIHPDVDVQRLHGLQSWEYALVNEQVVVGTWQDDPRLFAEAQGDVVEFRCYSDREQHLALVTHGPEQRTVVLDRSLWNHELTPHTRLVLQRDAPYRAIRIVPAVPGRSRFEVHIDQIQTRLSDLAGVAEIARQLLEDILLRIYHPHVRQQYQLDPLRGVMLYSKPGMGKTAFMRGVALWLHEHSEQLGFEVVLYVVKPNETKSMWHGEDARIVREDLWGAIRTRQTLPRDKPLVQLVVLDEVDSLGRRQAGGEHALSAADSDSLEAMLVEMDGMMQDGSSDDPPAYVLCAAMTNRPDRVDEAIKRPGRFDLVLPMPDVSCSSAEDVMAIYGQGDTLPWLVDGEVQTGLPSTQIRQRFLKPALSQIFNAVVLRYKTDTQRSIDVTAGEILANVHFKAAMNSAKKRAAIRQLRQTGVPAVTAEDVVDCLACVAADFARQLETDPLMLRRQLNIKVPVATIEAVPIAELQQHRFVRQDNN